MKIDETQWKQYEHIWKSMTITLSLCHSAVAPVSLSLSLSPPLAPSCDSQRAIILLMASWCHNAYEKYCRKPFFLLETQLPYKAFLSGQSGLCQGYRRPHGICRFSTARNKWALSWFRLLNGWRTAKVLRNLYRGGFIYWGDGGLKGV